MQSKTVEAGSTQLRQSLLPRVSDCQIISLSCVGINEKPAISFTPPAADTSYMVGDDVMVNVVGSDVDRSVSNVKLYLNDSLVRVINGAPYTWGGSLPNDTLLQNMQAGVYTLRAVVEDNEQSTNATEISIIIGEVNTHPTISFTVPSDGSEYTTADSIVINAVASDQSRASRGRSRFRLRVG